MRLHSRFSVFGVLFASAGSLVADLAPQPQISFTRGAVNTWNSDWTGVAQRTYFYQWSIDLVTWHYAPFMEFGTGTKSYGIDASDSGGQPLSKVFVRLIYRDDPNVQTLEQAKNADFDGDGVPNFAEIMILGTNPLKTSTNGNAASDGDQDFDGDGISNADEIALGLDPGVPHTGGTSGAAAVGYAYDDTNRLTGMTSPVSNKTYQLDAEGNIEGQ